VRVSDEKEALMWYVVGGLGALLYLVLIITLGVATLRNGHGVLFVLGFFLPFMWIFGALARPRTRAA
jgi:hypothetical protein